MPVKVQVKPASTGNPIQVQVKPKTDLNTSLKRVELSLVKLGELKDVNDADLQNGSTIVYDATTQQWTTKIVEGVGNIDGGTY